MAFDTEKGSGFAVAKYAATGELVFAKVASGDIGLPGSELDDSSSGASVALTAAGEVLVTAGLAGPIDLGAGLRGQPARIRHFVTRLDANGNELWTRDLFEAPYLWDTEPPYAIRSSDVPFAIAVSRGGGFFLGSFGRPGTNSLAQTRATPFVAAYDEGGEELDRRSFSLLGSASLAGLEESSDGALVVAGGFQGELDFGQEPLLSKGSVDGFVATICR
jgi:hypothetical protein